jgi:CheY-like chemotaxis protein
VRVSVRDTGIGIDSEQQEAIFDSFTQADPSNTRRFGGTGLGLAISSRILEKFGSSLELESSPGTGSTFSFEIELALATEQAEGPAAEQSDAPVRESVDAPEAASAPASDTPVRILLAEDERINALVTRKMIGQLYEHAEVQTVRDGEEAVVEFAPDRFDLILMDVQMPKLNGYEATKRIRGQEPSDSHVPILALTAGVVQGERERCMEAGMDDYVSKPVDLERLSGALGKWLRLETG